MKLSLWLLAVGITLCQAFTPSSDWENKKYDKTLDLTKSYVKEKHIIEAVNVGSEPQDAYFFGIPSDLRPKVALLISTLQSQSQPTILETEPVVENSEDGFLSYYKITLPYPVAPKSSFSLQVTYAYTDSLTPIPQTAELGEKQTLYYQGVKTPASPYDTTSYRLRVIGLANAKEVPLSPGEDVSEEYQGRVENESLVYGPFKSTVFKKFSSIPLALAFEKQAPLPHVYNLKRDYWVSHWSDSLSLEEHYQFSNKAVKLAKGFSRVDWMSGRYSMKPNPAIVAIQIPLTPHISTKDVYYTDLVGNVSTSAFIKNDLILKPRFPIFGDWNYNFTVGWNHELKDFVREVEDKHVLAVPLLNGINDVTYEKVELSFLLPEGATFLDVQSPVNYDSLDVAPEFSYFDLASGHTRITLTFSNLVDEMKNLKVVVIYKYTVLDQFKKVFILAGYFFIALLAVFGFTKLDFSLK
ncbi:unnamed protein product [Kuraishia capsulata CBS 1993]|uniref:Dolichyl-diphosphooligosaccharide--protein glycosyltransferase subunit 1 n=1 Tax=Kuraishia capsulata CBS 1993 TaxID=1382522 RepID=W6MIF3_9ASCO|nr:uncharacterized protein KUCA_T00001897001 [Kuraishia capsulata CBS 1993]CDK25926.1 unnamed protein product [Kuraishia capsulata CBS 1993]